MITRNTNGAVVVVDRIFMVVRRYHEGGNKEKQNEKTSNMFVPEHGAPFTMIQIKLCRRICQGIESLNVLHD